MQGLEGFFGSFLALFQDLFASILGPLVELLIGILPLA
jgi:hypothetical protein